MKSKEELGARFDHGTRNRYMGGCKCVPCRAANSRYESSRLVARANGEWNGYVDAAPTRKHLRMLTRHGIGRDTVWDISGVSCTVQTKIRNGKRKQVRASTERRILAVTKDATNEMKLVPAAPTWQRINDLLREGFTKGSLALRLGYKRPAIQINRRMVRASTHKNIEQFYNRMMAGS